MAAFLRALERTGKVREAAKDAGIDFSTAYQRRKAHGEFAAEWKAAIERFREAQAISEQERIAAVREGRWRPPPRPPLPNPSPAWGRGAQGAERMISGGQMKRVNEARWNKRAEARFFATLADTANVEDASEAAGFSSNALYARRLRHPLFAEQWAVAVEAARARLDLQVIELAKQAIESMLAGTSSEPPKVTIAEALQILKLGAKPDVPSWPDGSRRLNSGASANVKVATNQEIAEALAKRLKAFKKRIDREKGQEER